MEIQKSDKLTYYKKNNETNEVEKGNLIYLIYLLYLEKFVEIVQTQKPKLFQEIKKQESSKKKQDNVNTKVNRTSELRFKPRKNTKILF